MHSIYVEVRVASYNIRDFKVIFVILYMRSVIPSSFAPPQDFIRLAEACKSAYLLIAVTSTPFQLAWNVPILRHYKCAPNALEFPWTGPRS